MRQKLKRLLSLVLAFSMTMSLLSISAWATEGAREDYDYIVTLDNAQEETPVEGLAAELLARKGITDETGTWSSSDDGVLTIDGAWNAVAYRAGEVEVSYTYEAPKAPEAETPGEDLGVIPPETPGEDEDEGKDDTTPGENEGEDGTTPGENEGEDGTTPGENEGEDGTTPGENEGEDGTTPGENEGEDDTAPGENEGEDGTTPGENEGEGDTTPSENEGGENETTPDEIVGDDANVTEASRVYYTGPEGGEVETITETWTVLVQDCEAVREIRALMHEMLEKYGDGVYGEGGSCQYSPEELEAALTFFQEKMAALEEAGIGWPGWPDVYGDDAAVLAEMQEKLGYGVSVQAKGSLTYLQWQYRSPHRMDSKGNAPAMYKLSSGEFAYCAQHTVPAVEGSNYTPKDVPKEIAGRLCAILMAGYNGGAINNYSNLKKIAGEKLTAAEALSATQAAIWSVTEGEPYKYHYTLNARTQIDENVVIDPYTVNVSEYNKTQKAYISDVGARIQAVYDYLVGLDDAEDDKPVELDSVKVKLQEAYIENGKIYYKVTGTVKVNNPYSGINITVSTDGASQTITLSDKTEYTFAFDKLTSNKGTVTAKFAEGTKQKQTIRSVQYLDGKESQNFIRLIVTEKELTPNTGAKEAKYNVPTYDVTINKTGDNWTPNTGRSPLAGAKFAIDITKGTKTIQNWKTEISDGNGEVKFTGIPNGFSYTIRETAAPELYHLSTVPLTGSSTKTHDVNNSLERGDLTITKTVAGDTIDKTTQWEFTINLKLPGGGALPGSYHYTITRANGLTETGNISDGGKVSLAHDDKVTISDIPAGAQYSVTEAGADENGYSTTFSGASGTITTTGTTAAFTNTRFNGDLLIKKVVEGTGGDKNQEFAFKVELIGPDKNPLENVRYEKHSADGVVIKGEENSPIEFTLKHGEYVAFYDLPNGTSGPDSTTYTVTELNANGNGYHAKAEVTGTQAVDPGVSLNNIRKSRAVLKEDVEYKDTNYTVQGADVSISRPNEDTGRWNIVTFTNTRELGSLAISKTVDGEVTNEAARPWTFNVKLEDVDGHALDSQWLEYKVGEAVSTLTLDPITHTGTLTLKHDETAKFEKLPYGTKYEISEVEVDASGYKTTLDQNGGTNGSGVIGNAKPDETGGTKDHTLAYTNAWTKGALEVTKTMGGPAKADERITFEIALDLSRADILKDTGTKVDVKDLANWISGDDQSENVTTQFDETGEKWIVSITKDVKTDGEEVIATLGNIPTGVTYTVTETTERLTEEGYEVVYDITGATGNVVDGKTTSGTISSDGETDKIKARDYRGEGTLVISKDVTGNAIENAGEQFEFTIDLLVPKTATEDIIKETVQIAFESKMYPNVSHELVPNGEIEEGEKAGWHKWTLTANLVDDAKLTVSGLPAATEYTVKEMKANANGYITTVTFSGTAQNVTINNADGTASGTIANSKPDDKTVVDSYLYTNMRNEGDLAVLKLIDGDGAYDEDDFNFTLKLISAYAYSKTETGGEAGAGFVDDDVDPMGVDTLNNSQHWWNAGIIGHAAYSVIGMDGEPVKEGYLYDDFYDVSDGLFHFSLKGGQMLIVNGLPNETWYEVTEDNFNGNGYSSTVIDDPYGTELFDDADVAVLPEAGITETGIGGYIPGIDTDNIDNVEGVTELDKITSTVLFQNHRGAGKLSITKELRGSGADAGRSWTFDVVLRDANGELLTKSEWTTNGEPNAIELDGQAVTLENGTVTFTMRGGETRTITGLPNGTTYTITEREANQEGYDTYLGGGDSWTGVIDEAGEKTVFSVTVVNRRDPGTLTVRKTVTGNAGWRYRDRLFDFTVALEAAPGDTLPAFVEVEGSSDSPAVEAPAYTQLEVVNGEVSFQLTDGQSLTIKNLSKDTRYTVAEAPVTEYYFDGVTTEGDLEGVIDPEETLGVHFINRFYEGPGGDDDDDDDDETTQTFEEPPEEYYPELPDPNEPDSPDTVTILEDDVPTTYVKVPDPENEEEFVYIPEDDVPLFGFEIPETGDSGRTVLWAALSAVSLTGIVVLSLPSRKKEEEE